MDARGGLTLDASRGEGGGQIVRTALALAVAARRPLTLENIRARRPRPGLQPQHLTAVRALAAVSDAVVEGAELHSSAIRFVPRATTGGVRRFDVGTAGAVSLILQALLLPLALAPEPAQVTLTGGTHVPWSPPFQYLADVFLPAIGEMGVDARATLRRWGWYPRGGGEIEAAIRPTPGRLRPFVAEAAPAVPRVRGVSAVSRLPRSIAERQRARALERLAAAGVAADVVLEEDATALGPGTLVFLGVRARAGASALGRRGVPAERVADEAATAMLSWLASGAAVDEHLADQLVPFCALASGESRFTCPAVSPHLETIAAVVERMVPVRVTLRDARPARVVVSPRP